MRIKILKVISVSVALSLMINSVVIPAPVNSPQSTVHSPQIYIPEQYGKIEKSIVYGPWTMDPKSPTVILVKDAHCVYEAQTNIARILDILIRDYKIDLVCVEGASGLIDPSIIINSPDKKRRKEVADKYLKKGWLTASEVLAMERGKDYGFSIWGVEDFKLYINNLKTFRDVYSRSEIAERFLEIAEDIVSKLKNKLYSPDALLFDKKIKEYRQNAHSLTDLIGYLYSTAKEDFLKYPNLRLVLKALYVEKAIDFSKVERERAVLIKDIENRFAKETIQEFVKNSLLYKLGKVSSREYYHYLKQFITPKEYKKYPNLYRYMKNIILHSKIDENVLFKELDAVIKDTYRNCIQDEISWKLHTIDEHINLLNKLLRLEITREELIEYRQSDIKLSNIAGFLKIQGGIHNIPIVSEFTDTSFLTQAEDFYKQPEGFYKYALSRDNAIIENLVTKMKDTNKDKAILIVGGFHADGAERLLKEKGIQVIMITPSITKVDTEAKKVYLSRIMDERIQPEKILAGINYLSPPDLLDPHLRASFQKVIDGIADEQSKSRFGKLLAGSRTVREFAGKLKATLSAGEKWGIIKTFIESMSGGEVGAVVESVFTDAFPELMIDRKNYNVGHGEDTEASMPWLEKQLPKHPKTRIFIENLVSQNIFIWITVLAAAYLNLNIILAGIIALPITALLFSILHFEFGMKQLRSRFFAGLIFFSLFIIIPILIAVDVGVVVILPAVAGILIESFLVHSIWNKKTKIIMPETIPPSKHAHLTRMNTNPGRLDNSSRAISALSSEFSGKVTVYDIGTGWDGEDGPATTKELAKGLRGKADIIGIDNQIPDYIIATETGYALFDSNDELIVAVGNLERLVDFTGRPLHTRETISQEGRQYYETLAKRLREEAGGRKEYQDANGFKIIFDPINRHKMNNLQLIKGDLFKIDELKLPTKAHIVRIANTLIPHYTDNLGESVTNALRALLPVVEEHGYVLIGFSDSTGILNEEEYLVYKKEGGNFILDSYMFSGPDDKNLKIGVGRVENRADGMYPPARRMESDLIDILQMWEKESPDFPASQLRGFNELSYFIGLGSNHKKYGTMEYHEDFLELLTGAMSFLAEQLNPEGFSARVLGTMISVKREAPETAEKGSLKERFMQAIKEYYLERDVPMVVEPLKGNREGSAPGEFMGKIAADVYGNVLDNVEGKIIEENGQEYLLLRKDGRELGRFKVTERPPPDVVGLRIADILGRSREELDAWNFGSFFNWAGTRSLIVNRKKFYILEDDAKINGYSNGQIFCLKGEFRRDPLAEFHELAAGYLKDNPEIIRNLLRGKAWMEDRHKPLSAHTYLRGAGKYFRYILGTLHIDVRDLEDPRKVMRKIRDAEQGIERSLRRPITAEEALLLCLNCERLRERCRRRHTTYVNPAELGYGLQDILFGETENLRLTLRNTASLKRQRFYGGLELDRGPQEQVEVVSHNLTARLEREERKVSRLLGHELYSRLLAMARGVGVCVMNGREVYPVVIEDYERNYGIYIHRQLYDLLVADRSGSMIDSVVLFCLIQLLLKQYFGRLEPWYGGLARIVVEKLYGRKIPDWRNIWEIYRSLDWREIYEGRRIIEDGLGRIPELDTILDTIYGKGDALVFDFQDLLDIRKKAVELRKRLRRYLVWYASSIRHGRDAAEREYKEYNEKYVSVKGRSGYFDRKLINISGRIGLTFRGIEGLLVEHPEVMMAVAFSHFVKELQELENEIRTFREEIGIAIEPPGRQGGTSWLPQRQRESTYYDILGIPPDAGKAEIRRAYIKLAMQYHPDHNPGNPVAEEQYGKIRKAYEALMRTHRGYEHERDLNPGIRTALKEGNYSAVAYNNKGEIVGIQRVTGKIDDIDIPEGKRRFISKEIKNLRKAIAKLQDEDIGLLQNVMVIFIPGQKAHYGVSRAQIYLDRDLLVEGKTDALVRRIHHELQERKRVRQEMPGWEDKIEELTEKVHRELVIEELAELLGLDKDEKTKGDLNSILKGESLDLLHALRELLMSGNITEDKFKDRLQVIFKSAEVVVKALNLIKDAGIIENTSSVQEMLVIYIAMGEVKKRETVSPRNLLKPSEIVEWMRSFTREQIMENGDLSFIEYLEYLLKKSCELHNLHVEAPNLRSLISGPESEPTDSAVQGMQAVRKLSLRGGSPDEIGMTDEAIPPGLLRSPHSLAMTDSDFQTAPTGGLGALKDIDAPRVPVIEQLSIIYFVGALVWTEFSNWLMYWWSNIDEVVLYIKEHFRSCCAVLTKFLNTEARQLELIKEKLKDKYEIIQLYMAKDCYVPTMAAESLTPALVVNNSFYLARDIASDKMVLIKVGPFADIEMHLIGAQNFSHPSLMKVYEYGRVDTIAYAVLEFIEGQTVEEKIKKEEIHLEGIFKIMIDTANAIKYLHDSRIMHGDIQIENIIVKEDGGAVVIDYSYGYSCCTSDPKDFHLDIKGLAKVMLYMLTGNDDSWEDGSFSIDDVRRAIQQRGRNVMKESLNDAPSLSSHIASMMYSAMTDVTYSADSLIDDLRLCEEYIKTVKKGDSAQSPGAGDENGARNIGGKEAQTVERHREKINPHLEDWLKKNATETELKVIDYYREGGKWMPYKVKYKQKIADGKIEIGGEGYYDVNGNPIDKGDAPLTDEQYQLSPQEQAILNDTLRICGYDGITNKQGKPISVKFRVVLGETAVGWMGDLEHSSLVHVGERSATIWFGEGLFRNLLSGEEDTLRDKVFSHEKERLVGNHGIDNDDGYRELVSEVNERCELIKENKMVAVPISLKAGQLIKGIDKEPTAARPQGIAAVSLTREGAPILPAVEPTTFPQASELTLVERTGDCTWSCRDEGGRTWYIKRRKETRYVAAEKMGYLLAQALGVNVPKWTEVKLADIPVPDTLRAGWDNYIREIGLNPEKLNNEEALLIQDVENLSKEDLAQKESSGLEEILAIIDFTENNDFKMFHNGYGLHSIVSVQEIAGVKRYILYDLEEVGLCVARKFLPFYYGIDLIVHGLGSLDKERLLRAVKRIENMDVNTLKQMAIDAGFKEEDIDISVLEERKTSLRNKVGRHLRKVLRCLKDREEVKKYLRYLPLGKEQTVTFSSYIDRLGKNPDYTVRIWDDFLADMLGSDKEVFDRLIRSSEEEITDYADRHNPYLRRNLMCIAHALSDLIREISQRSELTAGYTPQQRENFRQAMSEGRRLVKMIRQAGRSVKRIDVKTSTLYKRLDATASYIDPPNGRRSPQMGKRDSVEEVIVDALGNPVGFKVKGKEDVISLTKSNIDIGSQITDLQGLCEDQGHKSLIGDVFSLLSLPNDSVYAFSNPNLIEDLFGFAWPDHKFIALRESIANNPIALFHEIGEYLLAIGEINIEVDESTLLIKDKNGEEIGRITIIREDAIRQFRKAKKHWNDINKRNHYLLRALQRQVLGENDRRLTRRIKGIQAVNSITGASVINKEELPARLHDAIAMILDEVLVEFNLDKKVTIHTIGSYTFNTYVPNQYGLPDDFDFVILYPGGRISPKKKINMIGQRFKDILMRTDLINQIYEKANFKVTILPKKEDEYALVKIEIETEGDNPDLSIDLNFSCQKEGSKGVNGIKYGEKFESNLERILSGISNEEDSEDGRQHILALIRSLKKIFKDHDIYTHDQYGLGGVRTEQLVLQLCGVEDQLGTPIINRYDSLQEFKDAFSIDCVLDKLNNAVFENDALRSPEDFLRIMPIWYPVTEKNLTEQVVRKNKKEMTDRGLRKLAGVLFKLRGRKRYIKQEEAGKQGETQVSGEVGPSTDGKAQLPPAAGGERHNLLDVSLLYYTEDKELLVTELFLRSLGVDFPLTDVVPLGDDYFVSDVSGEQIKSILPYDSEFKLLSCKIGDKLYPLAILFYYKPDDRYFLMNVMREYGERDSQLIDLLNTKITVFLRKDSRRYARDQRRIIVQENPGSPDCVYKGYLPLFPRVFPVDNPYVVEILNTVVPRLSSGKKILVIGTGAGLEAVSIVKLKGIQVDVIDINPITVANTLSSAIYTDTQDLIRAWVSDGLSAVSGKYDVIIFNAPLANKDANADLDTNLVDPGARLLKRIFSQLPNHLTADGSLFLMSRRSIRHYLHKNLCSTVEEKFSVEGVPLAIHRVRVKSSPAASPQAPTLEFEQKGIVRQIIKIAGTQGEERGGAIGKWILEGELKVENGCLVGVLQGIGENKGKIVRMVKETEKQTALAEKQENEEIVVIEAKTIQRSEIEDKIQLVMNVSGLENNKIFESIVNSIPEQIYAISNNPYIQGYGGAEGVFVNEDLLKGFINANLIGFIALFHEAGHTWIENDSERIDQIVEMLDRKWNTWYEQKIERYGTAPKAHYVLRALQKQLFEEKDKDLTSIIKARQLMKQLMNMDSKAYFRKQKRWLTKDMSRHKGLTVEKYRERIKMDKTRRLFDQLVKFAEVRNDEEVKSITVDRLKAKVMTFTDQYIREYGGDAFIEYIFWLLKVFCELEGMDYIDLLKSIQTDHNFAQSIRMAALNEIESQDYTRLAEINTKKKQHKGSRRVKNAAEMVREKLAKKRKALEEFFRKDFRQFRDKFNGGELVARNTLEQKLRQIDADLAFEFGWILTNLYIDHILTQPSYKKLYFCNIRYFIPLGLYLVMYYEEGKVFYGLYRIKKHSDCVVNGKNAQVYFGDRIVGNIGTEKKGLCLRDTVLLFRSSIKRQALRYYRIANSGPDDSRILNQSEKIERDYIVNPVRGRPSDVTSERATTALGRSASNGVKNIKGRKMEEIEDVLARNIIHHELGHAAGQSCGVKSVTDTSVRDEILELSQYFKEKGMAGRLIVHEMIAFAAELMHSSCMDLVFLSIFSHLEKRNLLFSKHGVLKDGLTSLVSGDVIPEGDKFSNISTIYHAAASGVILQWFARKLELDTDKYLLSNESIKLLRENILSQPIEKIVPLVNELYKILIGRDGMSIQEMPFEKEVKKPSLEETIQQLRNDRTIRLSHSNQAIKLLVESISKEDEKKRPVVYDVCANYYDVTGPFESEKLACILQGKADVVGIGLEYPSYAVVTSHGIAYFDKDDELKMYFEKDGVEIKENDALLKEQYKKLANRLKRKAKGMKDYTDKKGNRIIFDPIKSFRKENLHLCGQMDESLKNADIVRISNVNSAFEKPAEMLKSLLSKVNEGGYVMIGRAGKASLIPQEEYVVYKKCGNRFILDSYLFSVSFGRGITFGCNDYWQISPAMAVQKGLFIMLKSSCSPGEFSELCKSMDRNMWSGREKDRIKVIRHSQLAAERIASRWKEFHHVEALGTMVRIDCSDMNEAGFRLAKGNAKIDDKDEYSLVELLYQLEKWYFNQGFPLEVSCDTVKIKENIIEKMDIIPLAKDNLAELGPIDKAIAIAYRKLEGALIDVKQAAENILAELSKITGDISTFYNCETAVSILEAAKDENLLMAIELLKHCNKYKNYKALMTIKNIMRFVESTCVKDLRFGYPRPVLLNIENDIISKIHQEDYENICSLLGSKLLPEEDYARYRHVSELTYYQLKHTINLNGHEFKWIRLERVNFNHDGYRSSHWHERPYPEQQGSITYRKDVSYETMSFGDAVNAFNKGRELCGNQALNEADISVQYPIAYGMFPGLQDNGNPLGFVILGYMGDQNAVPAHKLGENDAYEYGRTLRELHRAGYVYPNFTIENERLKTSGGINVTGSLEGVRSMHELGEDEFFAEIIANINYSIKKFNSSSEKELLLDEFMRGYFGDDMQSAVIDIDSHKLTLCRQIRYIIVETQRPYGSINLAVRTIRQKKGKDAQGNTVRIPVVIYLERVLAEAKESTKNNVESDKEPKTGQEKSQIGKRAKVKQVRESEGEKYLQVVDAKDENIVLDEVELVPHDNKNFVETSQSLMYSYSEYAHLLQAFLDVLEKEKIEFYTYSSGKTKDLFGYASVENKMIVLHEGFAKNLVALFHEMGHIWIDAGDRNKNIAKIEGILTPESRAQYEAKVRVNGDDTRAHYVLRALQRQVFGKKDTDLTAVIKAEQLIKEIGELQELDEAKRQELVDRISGILDKIKNGQSIEEDELNIDVKILLEIDLHKKFEIVAKIARFVNTVVPKDYRGNKGLIVAAIETEILKVIKEGGEKDLVTREEELLRAIRKIAMKKGIAPDIITSVYDMLRMGIHIIVMDPKQKMAEIDPAYIELIDLIAEITGVERASIIKAFADGYVKGYLGVKEEPIPRGEIEFIERSLVNPERRIGTGLQESAIKRVIEKIKSHLNPRIESGRFDLDLNGPSGLDFQNGCSVLQDNDNDAGYYLSTYDVVKEDIDKLWDKKELARPTVVATDKTRFLGSITRKDDVIQIIQNSVGLRYVLEKVGQHGYVALYGCGEDESIIREAIDRAMPREIADRIILLEEEPDAQNIIALAGEIQGQVKGANILWTLAPDIAEGVVKANRDAVVNNQLRVVFIENGSSLHAELLFGFLYAEINPFQETDTLLYLLKMFGCANLDDIRASLSAGALYFTVKLIRIKETLEEFRNRKIILEAAA